MFRPSFRESQTASWLIVLSWTLAIYVTIPLARTIQKYVAQNWSRDLFTYAVLITIVIALVVSIVHAVRRRPNAHGNYLWLIIIAVIFIGYTIKLGQKSPEEAVHFIQYGILSILVYRALFHRVQDITIYFSSAVICGIIGAVDEAIQWILPDRYWGLRDIWFNFFSGAMIQLGIAKGFKPKSIAKIPTRASLRYLCSLLLIAAILGGASLLNTPKRISWYAERIPLLNFLIPNESFMAEYGYLYKELDSSVFRSRFSKEELKTIDSQRAVEAAQILNRFQYEGSYRSFLKIYTPFTDPFVHEAGVHLYSRNYHLDRSLETKHEPHKYARHLTIAWHENQFMEKYFSNTLRESDYTLSEEILNLTRKHLLKDMVYESRVSMDLFTSFSEGQIAFFCAALIFFLSSAIWFLKPPKSSFPLESS